MNLVDTSKRNYVPSFIIYPASGRPEGRSGWIQAAIVIVTIAILLVIKWQLH